MKSTKAQKKRIEGGEKLYDLFLLELSNAFGNAVVQVSTPTTDTLEKFALIKKLPGHEDTLLFEMMKEYLSYYDHYQFFVEKGALYEKLETRMKW